MNNANAIALMDTGVLSTEKMLNLCTKASIGRNDKLPPSEVFHAFVRNWKSTNPQASNQNLIDLVANDYHLSMFAVQTVAGEWNREDFEYAFQKFSSKEHLVFVACASGKYTQQEVFNFCDEYLNTIFGRDVIYFWTGVVQANVLDAEGLFKIVMLDIEMSTEWKQLILLIISKNLMSVEQLMDFYEEHKAEKVDEEIFFAVIATGRLSNEQIVEMVSFGNTLIYDCYASLTPHLHLEDRSLEDLLDLGEKIDAFKMWAGISVAIKKKLKDGCYSDEQVILVVSNDNLMINWTIAAHCFRLEGRSVNSLIQLGEKVDSDELWPIIIKVVNSKKAAEA
jgi:hypothetical protein